jgi:type I restriction enzyme S subunit
MRLHSVQHVRPPSDSEGARTRLEANDILISITGEVGLLGLVPDGFGEAYINQHTCLIRLPEELQNRYIAEYLRSPFAQGQFNEPQRGLKNSFRLTDVTGMLVALPPLAEQKRIVAKVEELMALCDALEAQQQERARLLPRISRATHTRLTNSPIQPHLDSLFTDLAYISPDDMRRTIINLAFQGNLTQQLPYDDPADAIVQRLSAARSRHETKGGLRSRIQLDMPLQSSSAPFGIPNSWKWGRLHEVAWIKHGYAFDSGSFSDTPTDYVVATPGNFFERGGFRERGVRTKYFAGKVDPEFIFHAGDLIIPMTEQAPGLLGSPAFIPDDGKTYIHNQRLGKLCFYSDEVSPWFAYCFFNTPFFRSELSRTCTGMKVRHTSPSRVLAVPFPICSIAEQRRIVAKVDELMALVDTLEAQQQQKSRLAEAFAQTCVASLTAIASD